MYLTLYISIVSVMLVACPKEVPTAPCKNMDSSGTKCLDGAQQVSEPTTAQPPQAGMTSAQMLQLIAALKTQQSARVSAYTPNQTVAQVYADEESWLVAEIQALKTDLDAASKANNASEVTRLSTTITQYENRLKEIKEEKETPWYKEWAGKTISYSLDYAQKNPDKAWGVVKKGGGWFWDNVISPRLGGGGEDDDSVKVEL